MGVIVRALESEDHARVVAVIDAWWGGRPMAPLLPRLFFEHFGDTSLIVEEEEGDLIAFLVGFLSQSRPEEAYIHFVGVRPDRRGAGIARGMYERFFDTVLAEGRHVVRCVTAPINAGSIAFHRAMGFTIEPGDGELDGVPVELEHDGPGTPRVRFRLDLEARRHGSPSG